MGKKSTRHGTTGLAQGREHAESANRRPTRGVKTRNLTVHLAYSSVNKQTKQVYKTQPKINIDSCYYNDNKRSPVEIFTQKQCAAVGATNFVGGGRRSRSSTTTNGIRSPPW